MKENKCERCGRVIKDNPKSKLCTKCTEELITGRSKNPFSDMFGDMFDFKKW